MKRASALIFAFGLLIAAGQLSRVRASCIAPVNAVEAENCLPGDPQSAWDTFSPSTNMDVFATKMSVAPGDTIDFKVRTTAASYTLGIFRFGYYGGKGARRVATLTGVQQNQPACITDIRKVIDCGNWAVSASWTVPPTAMSGVYLVKAVGNNGVENLGIFVVRDDASRSDIVMMTVDSTWQAYNRWGGAGLYFPRNNRGHAVSYNRPFILRGPTNSTFFNHEAPMIRWLEKNSFSVTYMSHLDLLERPQIVLNHKIFLTSGHDEYWSMEQRNSIKAARDAGVNLALLTGNQLYWKTRWEPSIDGQNSPNRTMVCYKEDTNHVPTDPRDPPLWTGLWEFPRLQPPSDTGTGMPPNEVAGVDFQVGPYQMEDMKIDAQHGKLRFWRNTAAAGLAAGGSVTYPALIGYEWDSDVDNGFRPLSLFRLSESLVRIRNDQFQYTTLSPRLHTMTFYRANSGARVWGSGTMHWAWGLDAFHSAAQGNGLPVQQDIKQATINMFADMGVQPGTLESGLVTASPSTDNTAPTCTVTSPNPPVAQAGQTITASGTAVDTGGGVVAGVVVSFNGGRSFYRANGASSWSRTVTPTSGGTIVCRAVDDSGNLTGRQVTPPPPPPPPPPDGPPVPPDPGQPPAAANPAPALATFDPKSTQAGGPTFSIIVHGANFVQGSQVLWNNQTRPTNFVAADQLTATISDTDVAQAGTAQITVFTPAPGGGTTAAQNFEILNARSVAFSDLRVYPNPWKPSSGTPGVTFQNVLPGGQVKIFNAAAEWVKTIDAPGGAAVWDLTNDKGDKVASGYYFYLLTDAAGHRGRGKFAVIR